MKSAAFVTVLSILSACSVVDAKVSYDGSKAMRISVGSDVSAVKSLIDTLALPTWKGVVNGVPQPNGFVDLVVPYEKISAFDKMTSGMKTEVMHEDLGASIADESSVMSIYAGKLDIFQQIHKWDIKLMGYRSQLAALTSRGSTPTTPMRTICNFSQIL